MDAKAKLFEAGTARTDAANALDRREPSTAIKEAQRAIEHAIKALYPLTGQRIPRSHSAVKSREDPNAFDRAFDKIDFHDDLNTKYGIALLGLKGRMWEPVHEFADYGYGSIPPDVLLTDQEFATFAVKEAEKAIAALDQLITLVEAGRITIRSTIL